MKTKLILLVFAFHWQFGLAQRDSTKLTPHYFNTFLSGALLGCGDCINGKDLSFSFVTLHGIAFTSGIKLSAGAGVDVYSNWQMLPLLLGFTVDREQRFNAVYFHLNSGYSYGRYLALDPNTITGFSQKGGFTINPMIGYRIGKERIRLYIQAGYKYQQASTSFSGSGWGYSYNREYDLNRFLVQLGFGFN